MTLPAFMAIVDAFKVLFRMRGRQVERRARWSLSPSSINTLRRRDGKR